jgi:ABC-2 type transport system ATP-binding protein
VSVVVSGPCQGRVRGGADDGRMRNSAIAVSGLRKAYGDKTVLDGIDLLTGQENLQLMADLHHLRAGEGRRVVSSLLERFDLAEPAQTMAAAYSGGMRRKLDLAMTLVTRPQIIFLDEPTAGLDPRSRRTMWNIVRELVAEGVTVFLTTQYLEEADQLADRIAVLDQGHLVAHGTPDDLKRQIPGSHVRLRFSDAGELDAAARVLNGSTRDDDDLTLRVPSDGGAKSLRALLDRLDEHSIDVEEFSVHTPDLDDVFLALTSHASTEAIAQ